MPDRRPRRPSLSARTRSGGRGARSRHGRRGLLLAGWPPASVRLAGGECPLGESADRARLRRWPKPGGTSKPSISPWPSSPYLPGDPALARRDGDVADTISVTTDPAGAAVYLNRFTAGARGRLVTPPDRDVAVEPMSASPAATTCSSIEKDGYAPIERTVSGVVDAGQRTDDHAAARSGSTSGSCQPATVPAGMVFVPGGDVPLDRVVAADRPARVALTTTSSTSTRSATSEYKEFVTAGGYVKREFWKHPFVKDGRTSAWDDAMRLFVDRTGLPGPRGGRTRRFPTAGPIIRSPTSPGTKPPPTPRSEASSCRRCFSGRRRRATARRPAAVAACRGARSSRAIRSSTARTSAPRTLPVDQRTVRHEPVRRLQHGGQRRRVDGERQLRRISRHRRRLGDPTYMFAQFGGRPGFFASEKLGFRCVRTVAESSGDQGAQRIEIDREVPRYTATSAQRFHDAGGRVRLREGPARRARRADHGDA